MQWRVCTWGGRSNGLGGKTWGLTWESFHFPSVYSFFFFFWPAAIGTCTCAVCDVSNEPEDTGTKNGAAMWEACVLCLHPQLESVKQTTLLYCHQSSPNSSPTTKADPWDPNDFCLGAPHQKKTNPRQQGKYRIRNRLGVLSGHQLRKVVMLSAHLQTSYLFSSSCQTAFQAFVLNSPAVLPLTSRPRIPGCFWSMTYLSHMVIVWL